MDETNEFARVFLNASEEKEILQGFPWVFDNEISHIKYRKSEKDEWKNATLAEADVKNGSAVEVFAKSGGFLGCGIINKASKITVRLISNEHADKVFENISEFWAKRIFDAVNMRKMFFSEKDSYRLVFAEADFVPGFICEKYCAENGKIYLVAQFLSLSCDIFKNEIISALKKAVLPDAIYERSDADVRKKEGLEEKSGWIMMPNEKNGLLDAQQKQIITIIENGIRINVDIANGQKTGYFLDQKFNRSAITRFCHGKKVLDAFSHTGAFGLNAFKAGAKKVISADISVDAVEMIKQNIKANGAEKIIEAVTADVFDLLKKYEADGEKFDVIILDPPAFAKNAKSIQKAFGGYKEINLRAMRLLKSGGILVTCSCSSFLDSSLFYDMIMKAATDSHRHLQILEKRGAAPDHPILSGYPKSEYLKCAICRVM